MPFRTKRQDMKAAWDREHRAEVQRRKDAHLYQHPYSFIDLNDRTNITITDPETNRTILQRLSPTSARGQSNLNNMLTEGIQLKNLLFDTALERLDDIERHGALVVHLGMWYNFHRFIGWTTNHKECKPASDNMLAWISSYFVNFVAPLRPLLAKDFQSQFDKRADGFNWLKSKFSEGECDTLHPWWTLAAVISGISNDTHPDTRDAEPSILINFGCRVVFEVDGSAVCLHPGDVLIFRARLDHSARPVDGSTVEEIGRRFAVSLSVRNHIVDMVDKPTMQLQTMEAGPSSISARVRTSNARVPK